jgi:predicted metalloendopeptidase
MVDAAVLFGVDRDTAKTELKQVVEFEIKLANISAPREERRNDTLLYNPTTLGEIKSGPGLPESWTAYIQDVYDFPNKNFKIDASEKIIIKDVNFYANLTNVLGSTENKVIANYLGWRIIKSSMPYLNAKARSISQDFTKAIRGTSQAPANWKRCAKSVGFGSYSKHNFVYAASSMYASVYFKPEAKNEMTIMSKYIRDAFKVILNDLEWMDEDTKELARLKLNAMDQFVGYSDEYLQRDKIDGIYEDIEVNEENYYDNAIK